MIFLMLVHDGLLMLTLVGFGFDEFFDGQAWFYVFKRWPDLILYF
jgi:hypothetical protein